MKSTNTIDFRIRIKRKGTTVDTERAEVPPLSAAVCQLIAAKELPSECQQWFMDYLETGKLDDRLTELCERNEHCREALEIVFDAQLKALQEARSRDSKFGQPPTAQPTKRRWTTTAAAAIRGWLPRIDRRQIMGTAISLAVVFLLGLAVGSRPWERPFPQGKDASSSVRPVSSQLSKRVVFPRGNGDAPASQRLVGPGRRAFVVQIEGPDAQEVVVDSADNAILAGHPVSATRGAEQRIADLLTGDPILARLIDDPDVSGAGAYGPQTVMGSAGDTSGVGIAGNADEASTAEAYGVTAAADESPAVDVAEPVAAETAPPPPPE